MSQTVTVEVSDALIASARIIAQQSSRQVADVLAEWLAHAAADLPLALLSDDQVLALRDQQFPLDQQAELSDLLDEQREGLLTPSSRARLDLLMAL